MQNVIVTGGSRGLGLAMARTLAAARLSGYRDRPQRHRRAHAASRAAADGGPRRHRVPRLRPVRLESDRPPGASLRADFGPIYGLVNNAGLGTSGVLGNMRDADVQRLIQLNTVSPILLSKYVVRSMMAQREGRIINIASIVASTGYSGLSVYSATKASLIGFTRSLAREVGQLGITVNAIAPGFIATEMTHELDEGRTREDRAAQRLEAHGRAHRRGAQHRVPARRRAAATSPAP